LCAKLVDFGFTLLDSDGRQITAAPINYAVQACINKAAYRIANSLKSQAWRGSVAQVKGDKVYINAGSNRGIQMGMKLTALAKGAALIDPETKLPLGNDTEAIGTLTVTTVNESFSIAVIVSFMTARFVPSSASACAQARPSPLLAPPTMATLPFNMRSMNALSRRDVR